MLNDYPQTLFLALLVLALAGAPLAAFAGRVVDPEGAPVADALVTDLALERSVRTGVDGRFHLPESRAETTLRVEHSDFRARIVALGERIDAEELTITLERRVGIFEEVFVTAGRVGDVFAPESVAASSIDPLSVGVSPRVVGEAIAELPGVAENGQGGIFRTYSIRGVSRGRVTTLVAGARIVTERRAGASASFLDPLLVGSVETLRGPSSTYYGSGALGGVVQLFPRRNERLRGRVGFSSQGDEHYEALGWGDLSTSLDLAHRAASNSETPGGDELHSGFRQGSLIAQHHRGDGESSLDLQTIYTLGSDIRKSNTDFPRRVTVYPDERHLIARVYYEPDPGSSFELYLHDNELETAVDREDRISDSFSEAFDFGGRWRAERATSERIRLGYGAEYFGRRRVRGFESRVDFVDGDSNAVDEISLDDGEEDEVGAYATLDRRSEVSTLHAGLRWIGQRQATAVAASESDTAWVGSLGLSRALSERATLTGNVGFGTRFASLSERFFNGTTGRGVSLGNPELSAERSFQVDLGLRWYGEGNFVTLSAFYHRIRDYIERIEPLPDVQTTANLLSGEIRGIDGEVALQTSPNWTVSIGGHLIDSRAELVPGAAGAPELADVPANRVRLGIDGRLGRCQLRGRWQHRFAKGVVGEGERTVEDADIVTLSAEIALGERLSLSLSADNLLDESYYPSTDDKSAFAPGRAAGVALSWR